jgi:hypothetical protein
VGRSERRIDGEASVLRTVGVLFLRVGEREPKPAGRSRAATPGTAERGVVDAMVRTLDDPIRASGTSSRPW